MRMHDLPQETLPREKALQYGVEYLTNEELLALIIGSGVKGNSALEIASSLLKTYHTMSNLANTSYSYLCEQKGLNKCTVLKLLGTFEFHNRLNNPINQKNVPIRNAENIYARYRYLETLSQEVFVLISLNKNKEVIKEKTMYQGTCEGFNVNLKEILRELVLVKCTYFILVHNHVDGATYPSNQDKKTTNLIENLANELGITLLDHVIIYDGGYYSFKEDEININ